MQKLGRWVVTRETLRPAPEVPKGRDLIPVTILFQNIIHKRPLKRFTICTNFKQRLSCAYFLGTYVIGQQVTKGFPGFGHRKKILGRSGKNETRFHAPHQERMPQV